MVVDEPMEEPDQRAARGIEPAVPAEPARLQGLPDQRELGTALGLSLRRRHVQLSGEMDGSTEVAAVDSVREAGRHAAEAPGGHSELLPDQGSFRSGRGRQWKHSHADQPWSRLQKPAISPTEGQPDGSHQHRIPRHSPDKENYVKWPFRRILVHSPKSFRILHLHPSASTMFNVVTWVH